MDCVTKLATFTKEIKYIDLALEVANVQEIIGSARIPVALIYELIGLKHSITEILKGYPHLDCNIILTLLKIGKDANENLINVDIDKIISKETNFLSRKLFS